MKTIEKPNIGVIGAGTMGIGIALDFATNGCLIQLKDVSEDILLNARNRIKADFRLIKMMKREVVNVDVEEVLARINFTTSWADFKNLDIIIENVPENWEIKKEVYSQLNEECSKETVFAANTSCISITKIASLLHRPENVIGMHFMNPVPLKKIVEVVKGYHTSEETIKFSKKILEIVNKKAIIVDDSTGFVANRLSHLFMNEAAFLVQENVASPEKIDEIFKQGYGHKMGPLETADLIGLDTVVDSLNILYEAFQDSKFRCCPLLKKMVHGGDLGQKTGKGFYQY